MNLSRNVIYDFKYLETYHCIVIVEGTRERRFASTEYHINEIYRYKDEITGKDTELGGFWISTESLDNICYTIKIIGSADDYPEYFL